MTLYFVGLALFVSVAVIETIALIQWSPTYFRTGIVLFRDEASASSPQADLPDPALLESRLNDHRWTPMLFRKISPDLYAFREAAWGGFRRASYTPVMRGTIHFDRDRAKVQVRGRLNCFHLPFLFAVGFAFIAWGVPWFLLLAATFGGFEAFLCVIQRRRYRQVAAIAAAAWSSTFIQV